MQPWTGLLPCLFLFAASLQAQEIESPADLEQYVAQVIDSMTFQEGHVALPNGKASLDLPENMRYLSPKDTETLLVTLWGNPSGFTSDGSVVPAEFDPFGDASWAVIFSHNEDGHVPDEDASEMDFNDLLAEMQAETEAANDERIRQGYEAIQLVGWAEPPHYDAQSKKLYWAKELSFAGAPGNTLNYEVRVLGRSGFIEMNAVAGMHQLSDIRDRMDELLAATNFTEGNRYADFDPSVDQVAAYGIGAIIAGKLAAKAGLFAKLGVLLLALKKLWIFILVGIAALFGRLFNRKAPQTP